MKTPKPGRQSNGFSDYAADRAYLDQVRAPAPQGDQLTLEKSASYDPGLPVLLGPSGVGTQAQQTQSPTHAPSGELITCPECGEMALIDPAQRKSNDFCRKCDFPLFWARSNVVLPSGAETGASLRRLPGTVGRAATAALICPHCGEPNSPAAENCIRCTLLLHPAAPPPEPVYEPAPDPLPEPEPVDDSFPLWWLILIGVCLLVITGIIVWVALA